MPTPRFNDDLRLARAAELLHAQASVAEAAVEALVHATLPWFSRIDECRLNAFDIKPTRELSLFAVKSRGFSA